MTPPGYRQRGTSWKFPLSSPAYRRFEELPFFIHKGGILMYDEPNMDMIQSALKEAQEVDLDALRKYAEQVSKIDEKTPLKTAYSICGLRDQNPDPKLSTTESSNESIIRDEFSAILDTAITDVPNSPFFEPQPAVKETSTFSPYDEIQKRLENLSDKQKELIEKQIKETGDWGSATDLAIRLITNSPTGASAVTKFDTETSTGIYMNEYNSININTGPALEVNAITRGGKGSGQPTVQPSQHTIIADKLQEILNDINKQPELFPDVRYYLTQAIQIAKSQTLDQNSGQPYYWNYIADTVPIGKNAVLVSVNGYGQEALLCYNTRTLFIIDNKLIKLKDPQTYSRTVWRYVHQCIDEHPSFWVYNTNIKPLSNDQRKSHLLAFYQKDMYKNRWK